MVALLNESFWLVAVVTPTAGTHVTVRPQQCWAVSLSAVNECLSVGWQHPPDHQWQGETAMPDRATRSPTFEDSSKVTGVRRLKDWVPSLGG